ncbi:hypothetical protein M407DRAFT_247119 [Tulasnella calospora MUT 4182]|uniref:Uncharacterized protein n=1 Tax=Tulasnella calospora MUT 4182 TaxID=1051891 RepID=A0A0C3K3H2_9AGAM|nr:hypothetical protein M407DRAFT_247119 [Tulasnella calospora MUT 4182]
MHRLWWVRIIHLITDVERRKRKASGGAVCRVVGPRLVLMFQVQRPCPVDIPP